MPRYVFPTYCHPPLGKTFPFWDSCLKFWKTAFLSGTISSLFLSYLILYLCYFILLWGNVFNFIFQTIYWIFYFGYHFSFLGTFSFFFIFFYRYLLITLASIYSLIFEDTVGFLKCFSRLPLLHFSGTPFFFWLFGLSFIFETFLASGYPWMSVPRTEHPKLTRTSICESLSGFPEPIIFSKKNDPPTSYLWAHTLHLTSTLPQA